MSHLPHFVRKRPCRICHCWFQPAPQAGERQHVCGKPGCQQERHRRACQAWHGRERAELAEERQVARLRACVKVAAGAGETASRAQAQAPPVQVDWRALRDAVPPEVAGVLRFLLEVLLVGPRDAVPVQVHGRKGGSPEVLGGPRRDGIASVPGPP
jgi:hypothetical protein